MDEFDVFMDAVARRVAMASLFEAAAAAPHLQFLFLTPQDVGAVGEAVASLAINGVALPEGFVKIMVMPRPRPVGGRAAAAVEERGEGGGGGD
jgi:hypothetical protein